MYIMVLAALNSAFLASSITWPAQFNLATEISIDTSLLKSDSTDRIREDLIE